VDRAIDSILAIAVAIISLATLAVILSKQSNTASVIGAAGNAFTSAIKAAVAPA
jgi:hypothetical protein